MSKISNLNLYFRRHKSSALTLQIELISTRIYLALWSLAFAVLVAYYCLSSETVTIKVEQPTEAVYEQLERTFQSSLQCPCSRIVVLYSSFVQIRSRMHQICYSQFIENAWIKSIFADGNWSNIAINQFLGRGVAYFLVQKYLCNVANISLDYNMEQILSYNIIGGKVMPKKNLVLQVQTDTDSTMTNAAIFSSFTNLGMRAATQVNQLINIFSTSRVYSLDNYTQMPYYRIPTKPISHGQNCSCATSATCTEPVFIGNEIVPGFVLGCSPLESLMRSTFVCLYNQTCLNLINVGNHSFINTLNASFPSKYLPNTTIYEMVKNIFLEESVANISYSDYFSTCRPLACTYLISKSQNALQVVSTTLSLYGGLSLILHSTANWLTAAIFRVAAKIRLQDNVVYPFA